MFISYLFIPHSWIRESHQASRADWLILDQHWGKIYVRGECAVTLLITELMAYEFEGGDWLIRQMVISQQLKHIDMVKGSVNIWLTASFVCCIYSLVCLNSELLMSRNLWTRRSWQIALGEQYKDFIFWDSFCSSATLLLHLKAEITVLCIACKWWEFGICADSMFQFDLSMERSLGTPLPNVCINVYFV